MEITLEEYKSQEKPKWGNRVVLKADEFDFVGRTTKSILYPSETLTKVKIKGYSHEYISFNRRGWLYTTDSDGSPGVISTFYIPHK